MRKLIIFLLFIVFTLIAIGFVTIPGFTFATQMKVGEKAVELDSATQATVIDVPIAAAFIEKYSKIQIVIAHDGTAGYIEVLGADGEGDITYKPTEALDAGATYVSGAKVLMWLFALLLIILLPKRRSKKKVKKLAREEALDVVDEEMGSIPARSYAPARRRDDGPRGGEGRRRRDDYDDDYDY
ncbi:MAG: hypothetical protein K5923_07190 [Clostridia bacterium]|nr:hypothetical protein [Clostridia bacterium]